MIEDLFGINKEEWWKGIETVLIPGENAASEVYIFEHILFFAPGMGTLATYNMIQYAREHSLTYLRLSRISEFTNI